MSVRPRRGGTGEAFWALVDQALSSLSNFALTLLAARTLPPAEFGGFALVFAGYLLALGAARGIAAEPLSVRASGVEETGWRVATSQAAGAAAWVGLVFGLGFIAVGGLGDHDLRAAAVVMGASLPALLLQDLWRFALFARQRGRAAAASDLVWVLLLGGLLPWAVDHPSPSFFVTAWSASGAGAALVGLWQVRTVPRPLRVGVWWSGNRDLSWRFAGEFVALAGSGYIALYAIGASAGLADVGALRAAQVLYGPLNVLIMGVRLYSVPEAARRVQRGDASGFLTLCRRVAATLALASAGVIVLAVSLPDHVGRAILGQAWTTGHPLAVPVGLNIAASGAIVGAVTGFRALQAARVSYRLRLAQSSAAIAGAALGAWVAGAAGAAWTLALVAATGAVGWWTVLMRQVAQSGAHTRSEGEGARSPGR